MTPPKACTSCGQVARPYDPDNTSDRAIADLALKHAMAVHAYGGRLEDHYRILNTRFGEKVAEQDGIIAAQTALLEDHEKRIEELYEVIGLLLQQMNPPQV